MGEEELVHSGGKLGGKAAQWGSEHCSDRLPASLPFLSQQSVSVGCMLHGWLEQTGRRFVGDCSDDWDVVPEDRGRGGFRIPYGSAHQDALTGIGVGSSCPRLVFACHSYLLWLFSSASFVTKRVCIICTDWLLVNVSELLLTLFFFDSWCLTSKKLKFDFWLKDLQLLSGKVSTVTFLVSSRKIIFNIHLIISSLEMF